MSYKKYSHLVCISLFLVIFLLGCTPKKKVTPIFQALKSERTGLNFSNNLSYNQKFNLFKYLYFYNGAGVGAGDFNNDGLIDLFFASNQLQNKLYLNEGKLHFKDVTDLAKIPHDSGWSTGVSVVDINNDGLLDIYVCRVGNYETLHSKNQLLINQGLNKDGIPSFINKAQEYGLDFSGFSTQAAFFDYDNDGDLDIYLLNHSVHSSSNYRPRRDFAGSYSDLSGDRIYRNNANNTFTNVTSQTGIHSSAIGYGLGIAIADVNMDGYPDIYIGNDFHENDYLYINQKNGTFKEEAEQQLMHTSQYTMGVDVADINNDAYPEIISVDMLPADPYILKRSLGGDSYNVFNYKLEQGYSYQYSRNNLQLNRQNGAFSEIGFYSGVAATDWSWAPLWTDFDNDGYKDLFISNGIPKRLNDIDYINFVSDGDIQKKITEDDFEEKDLSLIDKFPVIKLPNKFYKNDKNLSFTDVDSLIAGNTPTFSNGSAFADFDNDGDLDIIVNNIDASAILYENTNSQLPKKSAIQINFKGSLQNINAIGSKVFVFANNGIRTYEKFPVKGFMSSMEVPILAGLKETIVDSIIIVWPDNTYQHISVPLHASAVAVEYKEHLPLFNYNTISGYTKSSTKQMVDITKEVNLNYLHEENKFIEFDRESLIPHMISTEGPALAIADINHDGLDDVFIGSARNKKSALFFQRSSGKFIKSAQLNIDIDSAYEDVDASFADVNNDNDIDLIIASGGNEFYGNDYHNTPRIYLNDGKGIFKKPEQAFTNLYLTASSIAPYDFNGDGYIDLFVAGRAIPNNYGRVPQSYLLQNDKTGKFNDVTNTLAKDLTDVGFVTRALWFDIDKDGDKDLLLSLEWGGIIAFINNKGKLTRKVLCEKKGWWNFILPYDLDKDGDIDLVAGNLGLNSRLKATEKEPVKLFYNDFDNNGKKEQVITYFLNHREIPFANKAELEKELPNLKKKFLYASDFANENMQGLFSSEKLESSSVLTANYFSNALLINQGELNFKIKPLPAQAQFAYYKDAVIVNANGDNFPDIFLAGNYYNNSMEIGKYDSDYGTILINKGNASFACESINGLSIKGQVRRISPIKIANMQAFVVARNNDSTMVIKFK
jgi:hypothetical protein